MTRGIDQDLAALLAAMRKGPSLPEGWDVAVNLSQPAVQAIVASDWNGMPAKNASRTLVFAKLAADGPGAADRHDIVVLRADLPAPTIHLSQTDQAAQLVFRVDNGTLQPGMLQGNYAAEPLSPAPDVRSFLAGRGGDWGEPRAVTDQDPLHLSVLAPRAVRRDHAAGFTIELDLAAAGFTLHHAGGSPDAIGASEDEPARLLASDGFVGPVASLAVPPNASTHELAPGQVTARIVTSQDGEALLQILTGPPSAPLPATDSAPVPHPAADDFSVIVASKAVTAAIAGGYNRGTGDIKLVSVPPQDGQVHWFLQVHEPMVFEGRFGKLDGEIYVTDHARFFMRFGGSCDAGLQLFTFTDPASTVQLELDLSAHYPVTISGAGAGQLVGLAEGAQAVTGEGFYENIVKPQLQTFLEGDIRTDMTRVRLTAVSDLVLRDLTLPGHAPSFELAALPGDLLISGRLVADR